MPAIPNLEEATPEEVDARLTELRGEFTNLHEGIRSGTGINDRGALRSMIDEVDILDTWNTMSALRKKREDVRIAATAGVLTQKGVRSLGDAVVTEELLNSVQKSLAAGWTDHIYEDGRRSQRQHIMSFDFDGKDGKDITNWLRVAGILGGNDSGLRAVVEWGSGGPGNTGPLGTNYDGSDAGGLLPRLGQPIPPVARQAKLYLRDLMPSMTTTLADMPYVRELNPTAYETTASGGATTVAEGSTKPTAQLSFASEHAPVTVIASTLTLSKQMFADAPAVVQYVNQRLPYLVKFREDAQILNGSGTWPDMQGILQAGPLTSSGGTSGDYAPQIGTAMAKVENQDGAPTAVVMNPTDAWHMFTMRAAGGSGTFDAGTPFSSLPLTVWGIQTYRSRAYASGSALVSDFDRGGMLVDREQVNVQVYNERYAEQNLVLLICEERIGAMWFRPDLFCNTTLS